MRGSLASVCLLSWVVVVSSTAPKPVKIGVQASWPAAPLALEASEFIAEADPAQFWTYAEALMASKDGATDASAVLEAAPAMSSTTRWTPVPKK